MKNISILAAALALAFSLIASVSNAQSLLINKGDWVINGSTSVTLPEEGDNTIFLNADAQHFLIDRIAVGGDILLFSGGLDQLSIGPKASWYFWDAAPWTAYLAQSILFVNRDVGPIDQDYTQSATTIGAKYFITRNIAIGPAAVFTALFGDDVNDRNNTSLTFVGAFSMHF